MRIYATADGGSRVEELTISPDAKPIDITRVTASVYRGSGARAPDWHTAPRKQFAINMTGELEVELTDGTRRKIGSDLVYKVWPLSGARHAAQEEARVESR